MGDLNELGRRENTIQRRLEGGAMGQKNTEYEFGGPLGALGVIVFMPLVCFWLFAQCGERGCDLTRLPTLEGLIPATSEIVTAALVLKAYVLLTVALHLILPGKRVEGVKLSDGNRLQYKLNARLIFLVVVPGFILLARAGFIRPAWAFDHFPALLFVAVVWSFVMSIALYVLARGSGRLLAEGGQTGNTLYDFFIGHELNPRIAGIDLKEFCELTPGLIGWVLLDVCFAFKQYEEYGSISVSMVLVCIFHSIYVLDAVWLEPAILTTMDITTDGFGFMLAFGDLVWVPFTYSLQARYLASHPTPMSPPRLLFIVALKILGYYVFRGANSQKNAFRCDPNGSSVKHLKYINTERGTRLLISGWWGIARHINYTGDLMMGLAWSLPCGFGHLIPYFYPVYFACLLLHREARDEHLCAKKYGKDWAKYKSIVRYRLVPGIY